MWPPSSDSYGPLSVPTHTSVGLVVLHVKALISQEEKPVVASQVFPPSWLRPTPSISPPTKIRFGSTGLTANPVIRPPTPGSPNDTQPDDIAWLELALAEEPPVASIRDVALVVVAVAAGTDGVVFAVVTVGAAVAVGVVVFVAVAPNFAGGFASVRPLTGAFFVVLAFLPIGPQFRGASFLRPLRLRVAHDDLCALLLRCLCA